MQTKTWKIEPIETNIKQNKIGSSQIANTRWNGYLWTNDRIGLNTVEYNPSISFFNWAYNSSQLINLEIPDTMCFDVLRQDLEWNIWKVYLVV